MQRKKSAAEEEVGVWAVRDARAATAEQIELFFIQVDPMREDSALIEQAVVVVHVSVLRLRKELMHPFDFDFVLRDMRVHVGVAKFALQIAGAFQKLGR